MTETEAVDALTQRWITAFDALNPLSGIGAVSYTFEGEGLVAPAHWIRVTVLHSSSRQASAGGTGVRRFERRGNVFVQMFAALERGRRELGVMADASRSVFEGVRVTVSGDDDGIVVYAGQTREIETDGKWVRSSVAFPFVYFQTR